MKKTILLITVILGTALSNMAMSAETLGEFSAAYKAKREREAREERAARKRAWEELTKKVECPAQEEVAKLTCDDLETLDLAIECKKSELVGTIYTTPINDPLFGIVRDQLDIWNKFYAKCVQQ